MRRRFVVAIDALTKPQQTRISQYVSEAGCGWWHWIENFWLLTTKQDNCNYEAFEDMLHEMSPNGRWVALERPEDITWRAGNATNPKGRKISDWLHSPWGGKGLAVPSAFGSKLVYAD
jgi:hypothetical protein